jgi:hypothetical protein
VSTATNGQPPEAPDLTALEMAQNLAVAVARYAAWLDDPRPDVQLQATIHQAGNRGHAAGQLAQAMAMVSIAEDMHAIAVLLGARDQADAQAAGE